MSDRVVCAGCQDREAEIKRLRAERDEAREAARTFYPCEMPEVPGNSKKHAAWRERWPWLQVER